MMELVGFGLVQGSIIALGAIGLSLVYGILRFANFAHGEFMTWGAYLGYFLVTGPLAWLGISDATFGVLSVGPRMLLAFPLALAGVAGLAIACDRLVFNKLRRNRSGPVMFAMASFALSFVLRMGVSLVWGSDFFVFRPGILRPALLLPMGMKMRPDQVLILCVTAALILSLHLFLRRTRVGKAMRATADNQELARVSGIATERIVLLTW